MQTENLTRRKSATACLQAIAGYIKNQAQSDDDSSSEHEVLEEEDIDDEESNYNASRSNTSVSSSSYESDAGVNEEEVSSASAQSETESSDGSMWSATRKKSKTSREVNRHSAIGPTSFSMVYKFLTRYKLLSLDTTNTEATMKHFLRMLTELRLTREQTRHPFYYHLETLKKEANARFRSLFPTILSWRPSLQETVKTYLPGFHASPFYTTKDRLNQKRPHRRLPRFSYDQEAQLLYVGGAVNCISWLPIRDLTKCCNEPNFLALSTYPSLDTEVRYSDNVSSGPGMIQIWNFGALSMPDPFLIAHPWIHLLMAHDWGTVTDLCWIPFSVELVGPPSEVGDPCVCNVAASVNRTMGHLVAACQDGYVRIFAVPRFQPDPVFYWTRRKFPFYRLDEHMCTLSLSLCPKEHVPWIGFPTCLHICTEFPEQLFVGYSRGHVALYDLHGLCPLVHSVEENHLCPARVFHLLHGPVRSMALNNLNGRQLLVNGLDRSLRIWDMEDMMSLTCDSPEFKWDIKYGILSGSVLWLTRGGLVVYGREIAFPRPTIRTASGELVRDLADLVDRTENYVYGSFIDMPTENLRRFMPLGIQGLSCLDYNPQLNVLACATDRGRLEVIKVHAVHGSRKQRVRDRVFEQVQIPVCQWTLDPIYDVDLDKENAENENRDKTDGSGGLGAVAASDLPASDGGQQKKSKTTKQFLFPAAAARPVKAEVHHVEWECNSDSDNCKSTRSFCWHKLWSQHRLTLHTGENIRDKVPMDFVKTPYLNITQARFSPNPACGNWIAVGTACGFLQLVCVRKLYRPEMNHVLSRRNLFQSVTPRSPPRSVSPDVASCASSVPSHQQVNATKTMTDQPLENIPLIKPDEEEADGGETSDTDAMTFDIDQFEKDSDSSALSEPDSSRGLESDHMDELESDETDPCGKESPPTTHSPTGPLNEEHPSVL